MEIIFDTEIVGLHSHIVGLLDKYRKYIMTFVPHTDVTSVAQYILHTKSCNSFYSSIILCMNGLHIESYNAIRTALECGWLAILLNKDTDLSLEWLTGHDKKDPLAKQKSTYKNRLGRPQWVREKLTKTDKEGKKQKDSLYGILSTKSHANVASTFFIGEANELIFYQPGGVNSSHHKYKNFKSIKYCLEYLLSDIQNSTGANFGIQWKYDVHELRNIAEIAYPDGKGGLIVPAHKVNEAFQTMLLLYLANLQRTNT